MDILAALTEHNPERGDKRCKLQKRLDSIPEDAPGRDALITAVGDARAYPAQQLTLTFTALDLSVSSDLINDHRAARCACYR